MIVPAIYVDLGVCQGNVGTSAKGPTIGPNKLMVTGKPTDLAIDGNGYFVVQGDERRYTRDGSFKINPNNNLVTAAGEVVLGYRVTKNFNIVRGFPQKLTIPLGAATTAQATSEVQFEGNLNASGLVARGASILSTQLFTTVDASGAPTGNTLLTNVAATDDPSIPLFANGEVYTLEGKRGGNDLVSAIFTVTTSATLDDLASFFRQALGINVNVPDDNDPATPTPGVTVETDFVDTNSARLVITGNLGLANALSLPDGSFRSGTRAPLNFADSVASNPVGESVHASLVAYDSLGRAVDIGVTVVRESAAPGGDTWRYYAESAADTDIDLVIGTGTLIFDSSGKLLKTTGSTVTIDRPGAARLLNVNLDFSHLTKLTDKNSILVMLEQDGSPIGTLNSFSIGTDGKISGSFSNGVNRTLGQILLASDDEGSAIGPAGSHGRGRIVAGALEDIQVLSPRSTWHHRWVWE